MTAGSQQGNPDAQPGRWAIERQRTRVGFSVRHLMVATVSGAFRDFEGVIESGREGLARAEGLVHVASIDTGDTKRDEILRGSDFFDVEQYPNINFASRSIERVGDGALRVLGDLTIKGAEREVGLVVTISNLADGPLAGGRIELTALAQISRAEFGLEGAGVLESAGAVISDEVNLVLEIVATRVE